MVRLGGRAALAWLVVAALAPAAGAADRPAGRILEEIEAIKVPPGGDSARDDADGGARERALGKRAKLILELYRADPDNGRLAELMPQRWEALRGEGPLGLLSLQDEVNMVLARSENGPLKVEAAYQKAMIALARSRERDGSVPAAVDDFIRRAPGDLRGARLLAALARRTAGVPERQRELYRRILKDYPGTPVARMVEGDLRRSEGLGKPFALEFTDAIKGTNVSMERLRGKVVVIDFWATWCGPCVEEMPALKELYARYRGEGVEFIGVSLDEPEDRGGLDRLKAFVAENALPWPQYYQGRGWDGAFSTAWGIDAIPAVFVVAPDGTLASTDAAGRLEEIITSLLKKAKSGAGGD